MYVAVLTYCTGDMPISRVSRMSCGLLLIDYDRFLPWLRLRISDINGLQLVRRRGPGHDLGRSEKEPRHLLVLLPTDPTCS